MDLLLAIIQWLSVVLFAAGVIGFFAGLILYFRARHQERSTKKAKRIMFISLLASLVVFAAYFYINITANVVY